MQQQLQELELDNERQRYEKESESRGEQSSEQEQLRDALSRLRDLARRQADVNKQLSRSRAALEEADDQKNGKNWSGSLSVCATSKSNC